MGINSYEQKINNDNTNRVDMFNKPNTIVLIAIAIFCIYYFRKKYFNCADLWKGVKSDSAENIFIEQMNKIDNSPDLKKNVQDESIKNNRSYHAQKVWHTTDYLMSTDIITDLEKKSIIRCLS